MSDAKVARIGRFRIEKRIGRGLQGTVYQAVDEDLQRTVAIKVLNPTSGPSIPPQAQNLARLRHPNIVSLYEVGIHNRLLYLVFEFVDGPTLDTLFQERGKWDPMSALQLMIQVTDALAHAHRNGIAHLDLSFGNVMVEHGKVAKLMDFDLSGRLDSTIDSLKSTLTGTPIYMAPEHFTTRRLDFRTDVYAIGAILYELLTGVPAIQGTDNRQIVHNILYQPIDFGQLQSDPQLARFVDTLGRATQRRPEERFPHAGEMLEALQALKIQLTEPVRTSDTVGFLMRRMQRRKDFPALSRTLLEINQLTADTNRASADQLANVILRDYAVTNKLLKLANSSFYARRSGSVTSISEAIRLLGMQQIRMIANSLLCFSQAGKDATNPEVRDLQTHAFLAGLLARHLAQQLGLKAHEEAFICGMLHTLGKSLVAFYLPEEYEEILQQVRNGQMQELAAAITVLGVSYEELGIAVAQSWEFPSTIIDTMPSIGHAPLPPTTDANQILHAVSAFANRLCTLPTLGTLDDRQGLLAGLVTNFESVVALEVEQAEQLLQAAMHKLEEFAPMLDLNLQSSPLYQHLLSWLHDASDGTTSTSPSISGAHAQRNSRVASGH